MTTYIAVLRAVNLPGYQPVGMADLRDLLTALGFTEVRSLLQSGNLVFRGRAARGPRMERLLEEEAGKRLGLQTDFLVRTAEEWKAIVARNPFPREAGQDPGHLVVMPLKDAVDGKKVTALQGAITGPETVQADGRHAYIVYPNGIGRSRVTNAFIEKALGTRGTGRNWNTVLKIAAAAGH